MYKDKEFRIKSMDLIEREIHQTAANRPETRRIFLADGDAFVLPADRLAEILDILDNAFPRLQRVTAYANPSNLMTKTADEMRLLRQKKLAILYYGVESGDPDVLSKVEKGADPEMMVEGSRRVLEAGIKLSVTVILGLAGKKGSKRHARLTAGLINRIRPRYLSALSLMTGPHREEFIHHMGSDFVFNTPFDDVEELGMLIKGLKTDQCIFRSNHASNYLPLGGTLMKDKEKLLDTVRKALDNPRLHLRPDWMRGL
jgi:hypothetical protein